MATEALFECDKHVLPLLAKQAISNPAPLPFPDGKGLIAQDWFFYCCERLLSPTERPASFPRSGLGSEMQTGCALSARAAGAAQLVVLTSGEYYYNSDATRRSQSGR